MALYFLTYDKRKDGNYKPLYDELAKFRAVRILESTWCLNHDNTTAEKLRDHFRALLDSNDGLIVSQVVDWASYKTLGTPNQLP